LDLLPNLQPHAHLEQLLKQAQRTTPKQQLNTLLYTYLPERLVNLLIPPEEGRQKLAQLTSIQIQTYQNILQSWIIKPNQTEGYRTAEVTLGGVDCDAVSSKTMESHAVKGLYFIGEVLDVTGWLGGYNFQWAWSSGWAAGQVA
jgi:predicted Rossmann fold flavoprotein